MSSQRIKFSLVLVFTLICTTVISGAYPIFADTPPAPSPTMTLKATSPTLPNPTTALTKTATLTATATIAAPTATHVPTTTAVVTPSVTIVVPTATRPPTATIVLTPTATVVTPTATSTRAQPTATTAKPAATAVPATATRMLVSPKAPAGPGSWTRKVIITIANGGATPLSNYQVKVSLTSLNFDFSHAKSGGEDLRFYDSDDTTPLSYWIENYDASGKTATIWVRVPTIPASPTLKYIPMYYGYSTATPASDGNATFEFFDDFELSTTSLGYYRLSSPGVTVLTQDLSPTWENSSPHNMSVVELNSGGFRYWGYYGLANYPGGGPIGLARSNNLNTWVKYANNPIINIPNGRWPSVLIVGSNVHIFYNLYSGGNTSIVRDISPSSDGINFTGSISTVVPAESGYYNVNPSLFLNPNDGQYYLYWVRINNSTGAEQIQARHATTITGLDTASTVTVLSSPTTLAAPSMMYRDGTYFLTVETIPASVWQTEAWASTTSPISDFSLLPGNPILADNAGCFLQHIFGSTLHGYYCQLTSGTWTLDHRYADLNAGRIPFTDYFLDSSKWTASGGTWNVITTTQQFGSTGHVAQGIATGNQILGSSYTGNDYVLEAYGRQSAGRVWGLGVRTTDAQNLYSVNLYEDLDGTNNLYLYKWVNGSAPTLWNAALGTINMNTWYKLTVKAHANNIDVYFNDSPTPNLQATDSSNPYSSGSVALFGENGTTAQFNDVRVRKYAATEPTTSVGSEILPTAVTLSSFTAHAVESAGSALLALALATCAGITVAGWWWIRRR